MSHIAERLQAVRSALRDAAAKAQRNWQDIDLLAVSKTFPSEAISEAVAAGQLRFGENYVQEALPKIEALRDVAGIEWHMIGPLQSNKCRDVAQHFDWLQSLDREKLIEPLNRFRPADKPALNVLIQVNIDDEASKSGCTPATVPVLARAIAAAPRLRLRGLMAIPAPLADPELRRTAFRNMRGLMQQLQQTHPYADTLSMGMSEDFELAIAEGATLVRIGSAIFGARA